MQRTEGKMDRSFAGGMNNMECWQSHVQVSQKDIFLFEKRLKDNYFSLVFCTSNNVG